MCREASATLISRSSYLIFLSPGMSLVALLCIFARISMSFLRYGLHDMDSMPVYNILSEVHKVSKENTGYKYNALHIRLRMFLDIVK